jgi:hypothetical protein
MRRQNSLYKVILDKSFLQAESKESRRLHLLREAGAVFILTDTLIYEFYSDANAAQWPAVQIKLFPFADHIEVWQHVGDLLKNEVQNQKPVQSLLDESATMSIREHFRSGKIYVPKNLPAIVKPVVQEREIDNVNVLIGECRDLCQVDPTYAKTAKKNGPFECAMIADLVGNPRFLQYIIRRDHGNIHDPELYIKGAEHGLNAEWFAFHHAKSLLALYDVFLLKFGLVNQPGKDFRHTKLDSDYVALLHYADALATNETSGSLADMCRWNYGDNKMVFSTSDIDKATPTHAEVSLGAYQIWERAGQTDGHDVADWLAAEERLREQIWQRLVNTHTASRGCRKSTAVTGTMVGQVSAPRGMVNQGKPNRVDLAVQR